MGKYQARDRGRPRRSATATRAQRDRRRASPRVDLHRPAGRRHRPHARVGARGGPARAKVVEVDDVRQRRRLVLRPRRPRHGAHHRRRRSARSSSARRSSGRRSRTSSTPLTIAIVGEVTLSRLVACGRAVSRAQRAVAEVHRGVRPLSASTISTRARRRQPGPEHTRGVGRIREPQAHQLDPPPQAMPGAAVSRRGRGDGRPPRRPPPRSRRRGTASARRARPTRRSCRRPPTPRAAAPGTTASRRPRRPS